MQFNNYVFELCSSKNGKVPTLCVKVKAPNGKIQVMGMKEAESFFNNIVEKTQAKNIVLSSCDTFDSIPLCLRSVIKKEFPCVNFIRVLDYSEYDEDSFWSMKYKFLCQNKLGQKAILYYEADADEDYWHFVKKEYL